MLWIEWRKSESFRFLLFMKIIDTFFLSTFSRSSNYGYCLFLILCRDDDELLAISIVFSWTNTYFFLLKTSCRRMISQGLDVIVIHTDLCNMESWGEIETNKNKSKVIFIILCKKKKLSWSKVFLFDSLILFLVILDFLDESL